MLSWPKSELYGHIPFRFQQNIPPGVLYSVSNKEWYKKLLWIHFNPYVVLDQCWNEITNQYMQPCLLYVIVERQKA